MLRIELSKSARWPKEYDWSKRAQQAARAAILSTPHAQLAQQAFSLEVSVKLSDSDEVQQLNADYRGKDKPTNVLSFPLVPKDMLVTLTNSDDGEILLGDIILSHQVCAAEANAKGIALEDHATHLLVHGMLHLLGYDHIEESDANIMEPIETKALADIGVADPYAAESDRNH